MPTSRACRRDYRGPVTDRQQRAMSFGSIAEDYDGDADRALSDLLHAHQSIEGFLDEFETSHRTELLAQKDRAELK